MQNLPTVKAAPEMFVCYADVFRTQMATITPFTEKQTEAMLAFIEAGEGGFLNMGHYHQPLYDWYFKETDWRWPEFEKWQARFDECGAAPVNWPSWTGSLYGFGLYGVLMRHLKVKAMALHDIQRRNVLGAVSKIRVVHEHDRPFVDMALKENPESMPPFFPTDVTVSALDIEAMVRANDAT